MHRELVLVLQCGEHDVSVYSLSQLSCVARLRGHCYHGGAWWDQLILAIDRETLAARDGPLLRVALGVARAP